MKMAVLVVIGVAISTASAFGTIDTTVYAVGDSIEVTAVVTTGTGYAGKSLVVQAQLVGANETWFTVSPDSLPIAMTDDTQVLRFRFRPQERERFYNYLISLRDDDGGYFFIDRSPCTPSIFCVAIGEALATRGRLYSQNDDCARLERCDTNWAWASCGLDPDDCEFAIDDSAIGEILRLYADTGQIVDIYASSVEGPLYMPCAAPGTACMAVTRVVATSAAGCYAVGLSMQSWGSLKGMFR